MDTTVATIVCILTVYLHKITAVPPEACFANFRWDDCGQPPTPVMYYWKPGSRCEVGLWRGCLPNMNMFSDEYECVSTCIFATRADPKDFHDHNDFNEYSNFIDEITTTMDVNATDADGVGNENETNIYDSTPSFTDAGTESGNIDLTTPKGGEEENEIEESDSSTPADIPEDNPDPE